LTKKTFFGQIETFNLEKEADVTSKLALEANERYDCMEGQSLFIQCHFRDFDWKDLHATLLLVQEFFGN